MTTQDIEKSITGYIKKMKSSNQKRLLDFAKQLAASDDDKINGKNLLIFAGSISDKDLDLMSKAINEDCEKVNPDEW
jgi:hypothetical protein